MEKHPYDKVRKVEQKEDPTSVEEEMEKRVESFQNAMKDPTKRIGSNRVKRVRNPDGPTLGPVHAPVEKFDQLNKKDRWSTTEFEGNTAKVTVQDPQDPDDVVLPTISTGVAPNDDRANGHKHLSEEDDALGVETDPVPISD